MNWSNLWLLVAPPVIGGVIGYFTNDIAIKNAVSALSPPVFGQMANSFSRQG